MRHDDPGHPRVDHERPDRRRRVVGVLAAPVIAGLVAGPGAAALALVTCLPLVSPRVRPRQVLAASAALAALVPFAWVVGNARIIGEVSARLVTDNPWPSTIAAAAIAVALVGVVLDLEPPQNPPRPRSTTREGLR